MTEIEIRERIESYMGAQRVEWARADEIAVRGDPEEHATWLAGLKHCNDKIAELFKLLDACQQDA